jgi:phage FluMu gp28-like protein
MITLLKNVWKCSRIAVDATGIGEPIASYLKQALGSRVIPVKFSQSSKSELGFDLLSAINAGKLKLYRQDGSAEYREILFQMEKARSVYRPNQTINLFVDPADGHDDYLMSLALVVRAAKDYAPRKATGK